MIETRSACWPARGRRGSGAERGQAAVELVIVVPALVIILGLALAGGRIWFARGLVDDAAYAAARSAALARTPQTAVESGEADGRAALDSAGLECRSQLVQLDVTGFATPVGTPASVSATVSCTVDFADLVVPGLPGSMRLQASSTAPLDTYRAR